MLGDLKHMQNASLITQTMNKWRLNLITMNRKGHEKRMKEVKEMELQSQDKNQRICAVGITGCGGQE
jgi:hypothetical protein